MNNHEALIEALKSAIKIERDKYEAYLRYASEINNLPGVGQKFDCYSAKALPKWVKQAEEIIKQATE